MLNNRPEFIPCDLGGVALGGVPFSIYQTSSPEQIAYVVGDAGAKVAIVETAFLEQFEEARKDLPDARAPDRDRRRRRHRRPSRSSRQRTPTSTPPSAAAEVGLDDLLTLIYTSGTTGPPKGVQLTHRNLMALTYSVEDMIELPERGGKVISWLPAAHIAERGAHYYLPVVRGLSGHDLPRPAQDRRVPAAGEADLVLRRAADLGEAEGRARGAARRACPTSSASRRSRASRRRSRRSALEQAGEEVPEELAAGRRSRPTRRCSPACARSSASTRPWRSTSAPRRPRSRCSSSSTRSGSRSASCGGCRRPAASRP